jgi:hypothetical protein
MCIEYTLPLAGFELTTLVVISINCLGSCKSNYHMIITTRPLTYLYESGSLMLNLLEVQILIFFMLRVMVYKYQILII